MGPNPGVAYAEVQRDGTSLIANQLKFLGFGVSGWVNRYYPMPLRSGRCRAHLSSLRKNHKLRSRYLRRLSRMVRKVVFARVRKTESPIGELRGEVEQQVPNGRRLDGRPNAYPNRQLDSAPRLLAKQGPKLRALADMRHFLRI